MKLKETEDEILPSLVFRVKFLPNCECECECYGGFRAISRAAKLVCGMGLLSKRTKTVK